LAAQQSEALEKAMATLPEREQEILRRRFGLEGEPERRTEIAKDFERSATLIRGLEHRAIRRLREEIALQNARIEP
jgi:RNA polymerase sigma factor (sigma-70 family)